MLTSQTGKSFGIFGLGRTGRGAYAALRDAATTLVCFDDKESNRSNFISQYGSTDIAALNDQRWSLVDTIIISPGIAHDHEIFNLARRHNIPLTSDIDLLYHECYRANFIGITGTNGKSTTTALIGHILASADFNYSIGGNIGIAALSLPLTSAGYVLELSSFQLELIKEFHAKIAVLLNITPDHLDRHITLEAYTRVKEKIFVPLTKDNFGIIGIDNETGKGIFAKYKKTAQFQVIPISALTQQPVGVCCIKGKIYDNIFQEISLSFINNNSLQGAHNRENIAASYAACRVLGLQPAAIIKGIETFQGLPHRMQYIGTHLGIMNSLNFYNDSKATNAEAASKSISSLENIYWLAGGIAKAGGIEYLSPWFNKIKKAYLFGQDKEIFAKTLINKVDFILCKDLAEAFEHAFHDADSAPPASPKNILLAPAAASQDQFNSYEERGDMFIKLCQQKIANL